MLIDHTDPFVRGSYLFREGAPFSTIAVLLAGDFPARERLAAFVVSLARRYATRGQSGRRLRLPMPWNDVASHLRLAPETVSRLVKGFQDEGLLEVERREIAILDAPGLETLAGNILRG